jgi:hypothetical protein
MHFARQWASGVGRRVVSYVVGWSVFRDGMKGLIIAIAVAATMLTALASEQPGRRKGKQKGKAGQLADMEMSIPRRKLP